MRFKKVHVATLFISQVVFIVLFGYFVKYDLMYTGPKNNNVTYSDHVDSNDTSVLYSMYQDVHVMMLVGFGFLMTFLKRYGLSSVGFNFLLTCFVIQWSLLVNGWFESFGKDETVISLNLLSFLKADFAVATVLVSFGAVLGKTSPMQLIVMATLEVVFYNISLYVTSLLKLSDIGGTIVIYAFGAYFGLAVSFVLGRFYSYKSEKESSVYQSDIYAFIGTLFSWLYWPSFNASPAFGSDRMRAYINTIMSLTSSTTMTFATSALIEENNNFNPMQIQNAAIAGGVAIGTAADFLVKPFGALLIGAISGIISVLGFAYVQPFLRKRLGLHDTCGVHNLHGMPGILGGVASAIAAAYASEATYIDSYSNVIKHSSSSVQASYQIYAMLACLTIAVASGVFTGFVICTPVMATLTGANIFEDSVFWNCEINNEEVENPSKKPLKQISKDEL